MGSSVFARVARRPISLRAQACLWVVPAIVVLASCADEFVRDDAIAAVQTTGVSEAEATCIADSLIALDRLDAADPRLERTEERREAFVAATARCVSVDVLGTSIGDDRVAQREPSVVEPQQHSVSAASALANNDDDDVVDDGAAEVAVASLRRQGRTAANASCIVEVLVEAQADFLFADPNFGLGRNAIEANAIAACLGTS